MSEPQFKPVESLTDLNSLKYYQQLSDELQAFEGVVMYHFFKRAAKDRESFVKNIEKCLEDCYRINALDCGPYCPKGRLCVPCGSPLLDTATVQEN
jgi:hypothetical protein